MRHVWVHVRACMCGSAFLIPGVPLYHKPELCFSHRNFVEACGHGLGINERLIKEDQQEYHDEMKANYRDLARELSIIMHEQVRAVPARHRSVAVMLHPKKATLSGSGSMLCSVSEYCFCSLFNNATFCFLPPC